MYNIIMYIKELQLLNYRNYVNQSFVFSEGLNVVYGRNASGKTNLAESVYYTSISKSPRTSKEKDLIRWGEDELRIRMVLSKRYRDYNIDLRYSAKEGKRFTLDKIPITKTSDIIGLMNIVFFSPDELSIVKNAPVERRRFLDISLSQQKKSYFTDLINYNKVLDNRNKLLKSRLGSADVLDIIKIYNMQLSKYGARIINNRYIFANKLGGIANDVHSRLTNGEEKLSVEYESIIQKLSISEMEMQMLDLLDKSIDKDRQLLYTSVGAHRDDMSLSLDGIDARKFGSQGQQRTVALSLKMSEIVLLQEESGEKPILILDDVLSELDTYRQTQLLELAKGTQTILTCTDYDMACDNKLHIFQGNLID